MRSIRDLEDFDDPHAALQTRLDAIAGHTLALLNAGTDIAMLLIPS
jgi:hypothetical protein